jgi:hypothetical protein
MLRLTRALESNASYIVDDDLIIREECGYSGDAINRLARYENTIDDLLASQIEIAKGLEKLRNEGKTHSVKFRELMVKKLTNSHILVLFDFQQ